jgi:hypothetical protein
MNVEWLQGILDKGNFDGADLITVILIVIIFWGGMKLRTYFSRRSQKKQAVAEIRDMPCYARDGKIMLPTSGKSIEAVIESIVDDSYVVVRSIDPDERHYHPVAQFRSGNLGARISVPLE